MTVTYTAMILLIMVPLRIKIITMKYDDPNRVSKFYASVVFLRMVLCLGWMLFAFGELKNSSSNCGTYFTFLEFNWYLLLLITMEPAFTLGLPLLVLILCFPCVGYKFC